MMNWDLYSSLDLSCLLWYYDRTSLLLTKVSSYHSCSKNTQISMNLLFFLNSLDLFDNIFALPSSSNDGYINIIQLCIPSSLSWSWYTQSPAINRNASQSSPNLSPSFSKNSSRENMETSMSTYDRQRTIFGYN